MNNKAPGYEERQLKVAIDDSHYPENPTLGETAEVRQKWKDDGNACFNCGSTDHKWHACPYKRYDGNSWYAPHDPVKLPEQIKSQPLPSGGAPQDPAVQTPIIITTAASDEPAKEPPLLLAPQMNESDADSDELPPEPNEPTAAVTIGYRQSRSASEPVKSMPLPQGPRIQEFGCLFHRVGHR